MNGKSPDAAATGHVRAFTIVELLIVIAIILVLTGLILATSGYVQTKGKRSRAEAEIAAISAALENYKADNGVYLRSSASDTLDSTATYNASDYQVACAELYAALTGDADYNDIPDTGAKTYMAFKPNMKAVPDKTNAPSATNKTFVRDPFGDSYGYSTIYQADSFPTSPHSPIRYNPTFDLWSRANETDQSRWIKNW